jgi:hypothetical protein
VGIEANKLQASFVPSTNSGSTAFPVHQTAGEVHCDLGTQAHSKPTPACAQAPLPLGLRSFILFPIKYWLLKIAKVLFLE